MQQSLGQAVIKCSTECTTSSGQCAVMYSTTQGQMQSSAAQPILHHQEKTKRVVTTGLTRGIIEDLIESIPYYDQIISSMV